MEEVWKQIAEFPDYKISNMGRVMSCKWGKEKMIKIFLDRDKYKITCLYKDSKSKQRRIHRLIAQAFIPNPDNLPTVDHIDRTKQNNSISNLRWASSKTQATNRNSTRTDILEEDTRLRNNILTNDSQKKIKESGKYSCIPCGYSFCSNRDKQSHLASQTHLNKINSASK